MDWSVTVDTSQLERVERMINPPLQMAVTLPVEIDGEQTGLVVYIGRSLFAAAGGPAMSVSQFLEVAQELADRMTRGGQ